MKASMVYEVALALAASGRSAEDIFRAALVATELPAPAGHAVTSPARPRPAPAPKPRPRGRVRPALKVTSKPASARKPGKTVTAKAARRRLRLVHRTRPAARSPLAKRPGKPKPEPRPAPLHTVPPPPVKNFLRRMVGPNSLLTALDRAVDGMLLKYLEILDDGSPHLAALSRAAGKGTRWSFKAWRDSLGWVCPAGSTAWADVNPRRVALVSQHMKEALEASAGGTSELSRRGMAFVALRLPDETERWRDYQHWLDEGGDGFRAAQR